MARCGVSCNMPVVDVRGLIGRLSKTPGDQLSLAVVRVDFLGFLRLT